MQVHTIINTVIIAVVVGVIGYFGYATPQTWMRNQAVESCMNVASVQITTDFKPQTQTSKQPNKEWYTQCMKDKGYL